ncbi:PASTA domain-containing protein [Zhihengliuella sp.]|uniref:Stk1 family PASTA domain-containing Ser/Thr kinase n=1 Tax=Zhihengliuella sp. TaxID=1954483 RepID=UPI002810B074|nr:PASTA domain-containing protein [Zhihengliuella sp.]
MAQLRDDPLQGQTIDGRYRIKHRLANGGMSTVYLATDLRLLRDVAVKLLYPHLAQDPQVVARFEAEAVNAAKVSHEHIVNVLDQGVDGPHAYLVMEYIRGRTLRDLLRAEGALTPRRTLELMQDVTEGLAAAHDAGLVHRDMKPENVLLPATGRVKVADFGLARATTNHTATGTLVGTVAYVSPELVTGEPAEERSDLYAVGIMLYELLTGRQPHAAELPINVAFKHVNETVPPPSHRVPGLAQDLDELVEWCTAKDPEKRPHDAHALLGEIEHIRSTLTDEQLGVVAPAAVAAAARAQAEAPVAASDAAADADATSVLTEDAGRTAAGHESGTDGATEVLGQRGGMQSDATAVLPTGADGQDRSDVDDHTQVLDPDGSLRADDATSVIPTDHAQTRAYTRAVPRPAGPADASAPAAAPAHGGDDDGPDDDGAGALTPRQQRRQTKLEQRRWRRTAQVPTARLERNTRGRGLIWGLIVLLLAAILGTAGWFFGAGPGAPVVIPSLQGQPADRAVKELAALGVEAAQRRVYHEEFDDGLVVGTKPEAEATIRRFQGVELIVSRGPELFAVPNLRGRTADDAARLLADAQLAVGNVAEEYSESIAAGEIVSQSVAPDEQVRRGTGVSFVVSRGPAPVTVPDVVGEALDDAVRLLEAAGLVGEQSGSEHHASIPEGAVMAQTPGQGKLERGSTVSLVVSEGPQMIEVPRVTGKQLDEARRILEEAGFAVEVTEGTFGIIFNTVATQDPAGGTLPEGSTVTIGVV